MLQPCDVGVMRYLKYGIKMHYLKWASLKYINFENFKPLSVPDLSDISAWVADMFPGIYEKYVRCAFEYIDYSNNNVSISPTSYPNKLFLTFHSSDCESIVSNDPIQINDL